MKTCPKCGGDMRIKYSNGSRHYECKNFRCNEIALIEHDKPLSISDMATDMAMRGLFNASADRRKEQTQLRKLATGLSRIDRESPYLSNAEREALQGSAAILERLATATEKSKNELKRREDAEKKRIEDRHRQVHQFFKDRYNPKTREEKLILALALDTVGQTGFHSEPISSVRHTMTHINERGLGMSNSAQQAIDSTFRCIWENLLDELIRSLASDDAPIESLIEDTLQAINTAMVDHKTRVDSFMVQVNKFLVKHQIKEGNKNAKQPVE